MESAVSPPSRADHGTAAFLRAFSAHQPRLFAYVLTLVPDWNDAEEIVQETSVRAWESFAEFAPGTHFGAWIAKIAFHQVLAYRKRKQRTPLPLSDEFLEAVSAVHASLDQADDRELDALRQCLGALQADERDLLRRCYEPSALIKQIAAELGAPAGTLYKSLSRIRRRLLLCVERRLAAGERA